MDRPRDLQTQWARVIIDSAVQAGVRNAVISPGSRSTPFVLAALEHSALRCVSAVDERSAAHYALGQARVCQTPSMLICTSGSAPANYFPAVVEANEAGLPLVVLSADRPPALRARGANQTTDQIEMYGSHVRRFDNLGPPRGDLDSLRQVRATVRDAVATTSSGKPGPVQLNAQASKPLEPQEDVSQEAAELMERVQRVLAEPFELGPTSPRVDAEAVARTADALVTAKRPLIFCGPLSAALSPAAEALLQLAQQLEVPVAAEPASQCWFRDGASQQALGAMNIIWQGTRDADAFVPDFVLQFGTNPVGKGWELACGAEHVARTVVHPWAWKDVASEGEELVVSEPQAFIEALSGQIAGRSRQDSRFLRRLWDAEGAVRERVDSILRTDEVLSQGGAARTVVDCAPEGSTLVLGNSLPIRDIDAWTHPSDKALSVFCQRGVSGIDGVVSGAAGAASAGTGPTTLIVGDVSFLHDVNGLQLASQSASPLVIVVVNNSGGRIFEHLPIAKHGNREALEFFTTPHNASIASAASVYGCGFRRATTAAELRTELGDAYAAEGCTVVEAVVPRDSASNGQAALLAGVRAVLAPEVG